jgi:hypothetical protein
MIYYKNRWIFLLLVAVASRSEGQVFGGDPSSLHWRQINTSLVRVIFPVGQDSIAERIANIIGSVNTPTLKTIGSRSKKINLVLQNQTTISNAYVGLAPYRSEFLLTPFQNSFDLGSLPWPDQLTIHEYRHVQQYNNFNVGLSKVLYQVFGDDGLALATNASIPNWFFEGDAVFNETRLSPQGRGSLPFFYDPFRALWAADRKYSWMKLRNGSLRDFVPDHYPLGFLMVAYGRQKYGDTFWQKVTHDAASFKGLLYPFQRAIKKYSGQDYTTFRSAAQDYFKKQFPQENSLNTIAAKKEPYQDEDFPVLAGNDSLIYLKSGYRQVPVFTLRTGNKERRIRVRDYSTEKQFSYKNGRIVYAAYVPDTRWGYRDFSDLRIITLANGKQQTLTRHSKYFSPDINEDGTMVIAVKVAPGGSAALHLLDASSGKVLAVIPNTDKLFYTYPKFYGNDTIIAAVRNPAGKMSMAIIEVATGKTKYLISFSYHVAGFPCLRHDTLYFSCSFEKNDELCAYTFRDNKLWRIIIKDTRGAGNYQPCVNDQHLVWTTFTANGYKIEEIEKNALQFEEIRDKAITVNNSNFGIDALQKNNPDLLSIVTRDSFHTSKYPRASHPFNFHSIEPSFNDPEYSLNLLGENILNTFESQISFTYNRAEQFKRLGYTITYGGLFPFITAGINYTIDRRTLYHAQQLYFNELEPFAGFNIPLNLSRGRSFTFLNFGSQYVYNQSSFRGAYKDTLGKISYGYSSSFLTFTHQVQSALQQIFPAFAEVANISYKNALSFYKGSQFSVSANIYLPGLSKTHSLVINGAYLGKDSSAGISFSSDFPFSRGYSSINLYRMYKWGADYHFPVCYPDAGFGDIVYLLRIRANLFYDDTRANDFFQDGSKFTARFRSAGIGINFDSKWWNEANVAVGIRYSHLFDEDLFGATGRNRWEIILPVNIFNQ